MNCWKFLEIEPTEEMSIIKKAYAKKLKQYHPEDDPAGYQQLREAFDRAQELARHGGVICDYDHERLEWSDVMPVDTKMQEVSDAMAALEVIYTDGTKRMKVALWEEWLQGQVFWDLELQEHLFFRITTFIETHHYLPREVWRLLDRQLHWQENISMLHQCVGYDFVDYLLMHVNPGLPIITPFWIGGKHNLDNYFKEIEAIYYELNYGNLANAESMIKIAKSKWGRDHNIMLLYGGAEIRRNRTKWAIEAFHDIRKAIPENMEARIIIGKFLMRYGKYKEALKFLREVCKREPQNIEALILTAECAASVGNLKNAHKLFMVAAEQMPSNPYIVAFGNRLFKGFQNELEKRIFIAKHEVFLDEIAVYTGQTYDKSVFSKKNIVLTGILNFMILIFKIFICLIVVIFVVAAIIGLPFFGIFLAGALAFMAYNHNISKKACFDKA